MSYMRQRVLTHDRWVFWGCSDVPVPIRSGFVYRYLCIPSTLLHFLFIVVFLLEQIKRIRTN